MTEFIPFLGFILAALFLALWFLGRKKASDHLALLEDAATKYQLAQKKISDLEGKSSGSKKVHDKYQLQIKKLEKELESTRIALAEKEEEQAVAVSEKDVSLTHLERQIDHLTEENQAITAQLAAAVSEKKQQADELKRMQNEGAKMSSSELEAMQARYSEIQKELQKGLKANKNLKKSNDRLREILKKVDPSETKKLKARQRSQEQLFRSIKNLREMADERNQNWETAIRLLAAHVLGHQDLQLDEPIGPLLGAALEKIGSTLVIDEHTVGDVSSTPDNSSAEGEIEPSQDTTSETITSAPAPESNLDATRNQESSTS